MPAMAIAIIMAMAMVVATMSAASQSAADCSQASTPNGLTAASASPGALRTSASKMAKLNCGNSISASSGTNRMKLVMTKNLVCERSTGSGNIAASRAIAWFRFNRNMMVAEQNTTRQ